MYRQASSLTSTEELHLTKGEQAAFRSTVEGYTGRYGSAVSVNTTRTITKNKIVGVAEAGDGTGTRSRRRTGAKRRAGTMVRPI